jgi:hypothetical protein
MIYWMKNMLAQDTLSDAEAAKQSLLAYFCGFSITVRHACASSHLQWPF